MFNESNYVFRIDSLAERIAVTLGDGQGNLVSVLADLQVVDRVVIRGVERLRMDRLYIQSPDR